MMTRDEIKTATREQLVDELAAACEYTGDWETADVEDLRERVRTIVGESPRTYSCYGDVRGSCGHRHRTIEAAWRCFAADDRDCERAGGYSDRTRLRVYEGAAEVAPDDVELEYWHDRED